MGLRKEFFMEANRTGHGSAFQEQRSYAQIWNEFGLSFRELVRSDLQLVLSEARSAKERLSGQARNAAIYAGLIFMSVFPFLAFAVIGLGKLLEERYWLSALIVSVLLAAIGAIGLYAAFAKIRKVDLNFSKTKAAIQREKQAFTRGIEKVQQAVKGELHAPRT